MRKPGTKETRKFFSIRLLAILFVLVALAIGCTTSRPSDLLTPSPVPPSPAPAQAEATLQAQPEEAGNPAATQPVEPPPPALTETASPTPPPAPLPSQPPTPDIRARFAVIGDYGAAGQALHDVSDLIESWGPDFVITLGDNNYPSGSAESIDWNIGQYFSQYIAPYRGSFGEGASENRFFPTLGNHDWETPNAQPYLDYFTLPGSERYYDFTWGPLHMFALSSDSREPDGVSASSYQAEWLQERLAASSAPWKIVYMHHSPYSSAHHGSIDWMRWPFKEWGASAVISAHDHVYERLLIDGLPYFINGLGGGGIYDFREQPVEGSLVRYNDDYGAMLVDADLGSIRFQFINRRGELIDSYSLSAEQGQRAAPEAAAPASAIDHTLALQPAAQGDLASMEGLTRYTLQLELDYEGRAFTGRGQVDYTNREGAPLDRLYFRLFPNGGQSYGNGSLTVDNLTVDGQPARTALSLEDTVLEVRLPGSLDVSESARIEMDFAGSVPVNFGGGSGYGIYNFSEEVLALSGWYPILAVYDDEGWNLDPVSFMGDSVYSDTALYSLDLTAPAGLVIATTGVETDRQGQGEQARSRFVSGPVRDFTLIASPDFQVSSQAVGGVELNSYYLPGHEQAGLQALSDAAGSLQAYDRLFGAYPYTELDIVEAPMNNAAGVEYPGIVFVADFEYDRFEGSSFTITVAHEVAHQWWYGVVGNDVIDEPWLDEALATYASSLFLEEQIGQSAYLEYTGSMEASFRQLSGRGQDEPVTGSLTYFESLERPGLYGPIVYSKGALFFKAVREEIGDAAFFAALQSYYQNQRYSIAQAEDLLGAFEASSGRSLEELYEEWLY